MQCVGRNPESDLIEIVEIPELRWYIGTQFHPEKSGEVGMKILKAFCEI